jgi:hypothetical protein
MLKNELKHPTNTAESIHCAQHFDVLGQSRQKSELAGCIGLCILKVTE